VAPLALIVLWADQPVINHSQRRIVAETELGPRLDSGDKANVEQLLNYRPDLIELYSDGCDCQSYLAQARV